VDRSGFDVVVRGDEPESVAAGVTGEALGGLQQQGSDLAQLPVAFDKVRTSMTLKFGRWGAPPVPGLGVAHPLLSGAVE